ncbi:hypothetical protein ACFLRC_02380, partial [Candidatus Altiarchaeota archaeon]
IPNKEKLGGGFYDLNKEDLVFIIDYFSSPPSPLQGKKLFEWLLSKDLVRTDSPIQVRYEKIEGATDNEPEYHIILNYCKEGRKLTQDDMISYLKGDLGARVEEVRIAAGLPSLREKIMEVKKQPKLSKDI